MTISTIALLCSFMIVIVVFLFTSKKLKVYKFGFLSLMIATGILIIGIFLIVYSSNEISKEFLRHTWPAVKAKVASAKIVGEKAYRPQLSCKYDVGGKGYILITDLNTPGFGRKQSRYQTAEIILKDYPIGSEVLIKYNPENPAEAYIRTGPYWSDYMQLSLGLFLFSPGLYVLLAKLLLKFDRTASGRTST
jgi:Protein of unknown function (DUF3592)